MAETLSLDTISRYRNTRVFRDGAGTVFFGIWRPPPVVETKEPTVHIVAADEKFRPDLVASRVYGNPELFWAIALRNNLLFPIGDTLPGLRLVCSHVEDVLEAVTTSSADSPGV